MSTVPALLIGIPAGLLVALGAYAQGRIDGRRDGVREGLDSAKRECVAEMMPRDEDNGPAASLGAARVLIRIQWLLTRHS